MVVTPAAIELEEMIRQAIPTKAPTSLTTGDSGSDIEAPGELFNDHIYRRSGHP
jgi:hypothetical protein